MRFLNRGWWPTLELIYRFPTPKVGEDPSPEIASGPTQLVHDVSREAELGWSKFAGVVNLSLIHTHAAADTQRTQHDPWSASSSFFTRGGTTNKSLYWLWLREATLRTDSTTLTVAYLAIEQVDNRSEFQDHMRLTHVWNDETAEFINLGATFRGGVNLATAFHRPDQVPLPALVPPDAVLTFTSVSSAALNIVRVDMQFQITPLGVGPFGQR